MKFAPFTLALLITINFAITTYAQESASEAALKQQIEELEKKNQALRAGFINQYNEIEAMKREIAQLRQPNQTPWATATAETKPDLSPKAKDIWDAELAIGANLSRGNNDSHRAKAEINAERKTEIDRLKLALEAEAGENEGTTSSEYIEGQADYRRDIYDRLYWYTLLNGRRDALANLDYRFTLSPGLGYKVIDEEKIDLSFEAGPAYVLEKLEDQDPESSMRGRIGEEFNWQITSYAKLFQNAEFLINSQDTQDWILETEIGVETSITHALSLRLSAKDVYDNQPATGRVKNDIQLNSAIVYKFK